MWDICSYCDWIIDGGIDYDIRIYLKNIEIIKVIFVLGEVIWGSFSKIRKYNCYGMVFLSYCLEVCKDICSRMWLL